jgi:hypothetical protein
VGLAAAGGPASGGAAAACRVLTFTLKPEFVRAVADLPHERLEAEGRRVAGILDEEIFSVAE